MDARAKLIGCQMVSIDNERIVLTNKNGERVSLYIVEDEGDCCGYTEVTTRLLIDEANLIDNPIITAVDCVYSEDGWSEHCKITLFGMNKPMAEIEAEDGSGSGWHYGACVTLLCKTMEIKWDIVCW